jgi:exosortase A
VQVIGFVTEGTFHSQDNNRLLFYLTAISIVFLFALYYPTVESMVSIWYRSETFAHGFLILPIALWLVWRRRAALKGLSIRPVYRVMFPLVLCSLLWLVAYYVDVLVVQQLALVAMIPLVVLTLLGWQMAAQLSFPLFFLFFAVPMGEGLVPSMIDFTADFTVAMVKLVGIPIFREGTFFELPSGSWSVVEACSGVRYLIASVTLGFLYAYLTYHSLWKRGLFVLVSIIVPIIANGLRAFMIVMIGHYSGMELATGVDHLIYGWLFFGVVIAMMFYIGSFWREDVEPAPVQQKIADAVPSTKNRHVYIAFGALLVSISLAPLKAYTESEEIDSEMALVIKAPVLPAWQPVPQTLTDWHPHYLGVDVELHQTYDNSGDQVSLYLGYYVVQRQGAELITSTNLLVSLEDEERKQIDDGVLQFSQYEIPRSIVKSGQQNLLVAYYYLVDGELVSNPYLTKLMEARSRLFGGDKSASIISVATPLDSGKEHAESVLVSFLAEMEAPLRATIEEIGQ